MRGTTIYLLCLLCLRVFLQQSVKGAPAAGTYHAAVLGNYAGLITAGKVINELYSKNKSDLNYEGQQSHDFSNGATKNNPDQYDSLDGVSDNLKVEHFPADFAEVDDKENNTFEYVNPEGEESEVEESDKAASEHHEELQTFENVNTNDHDSQLEKAEHDFLDFYSKPVPGIDHGKGAFSYSTTYEFKEPEQ